MIFYKGGLLFKPLALWKNIRNDILLMLEYQQSEKKNIRLQLLIEINFNLCIFLMILSSNFILPLQINT